MKIKNMFGLVAALAVGALGMNAVAAPFGAGNIVIVRVGDGTQALTNTGNSVYLDEYTTNAIWAAAGTFNNPTPVQSILMPTNWVGANGPLIMSGTTLGDGELCLSTDGRYLSFAGYGATFGQATQDLATTTTTGVVGQVSRVIGLVDGNGHIYTTTTLIDANEDANDIHTAVSLDGTNIWHVGEGNAMGGKYTTRGSMVSTQVEEVSRFNGRTFGIYNKTLYYSANHAVGGATNASVAVNPFGGSLPTSFVNSNFLYLAGVMGNSITSSPAIGSPWAFCMFSLNGGAAPDTLYVADNNTNAPGEPLGHSGGVVKYCYIPSSNAWVNFGYIYAEGATGVTGVKNGTNVTLYITEGGTVTPFNVLYPFVDMSGFAGSANSSINGGSPFGSANGNHVLLKPPGVNASLINTRGIAFAPQGGDSGTISAGAGVISVGPPFGPYFSGPQGGPFSPTNGVTYSVANLGSGIQNFTVTIIPTSGGIWATVTPSSGTLAPGATTNVTVTPNSTANSDAGGFTYSDRLLFHTGGAGGPVVASPIATLNDFAIFITPTSNYLAIGEFGGPFAPSSYTYTLTNVTPNAISWTAGTSASWDTLSATSGSLPAGSTTNITVSIVSASANTLPLGAYSDTLVFTNVNAGAALPSRTVTLQVGFGFFDDFSTYSNGDIVGQNNWYNPTPGLNDNGYQIVNGVLFTPPGVGNNCAGSQMDEEPAKNIAGSVVTDATAFAYLGISITVTSAPAAPNTWDFTLLPTGPADSPTANVTYNDARTAVNDNGSGHYVWNTKVNGGDSFYHGTTPRTYFTNYIVIIAEDSVNSNAWVFVNPTNNSTASLFAMAWDAHDGPDVAGLTGYQGPDQPTGFGSVDIDNYCSENAQPGFLISRMALSTNYTAVYNFLVATNSPPPADPFTTWQSNYFSMAELGNPSFSGPGADPLGKGMSNTNQFLAGFNPTNAAAYVHITSISKTNSGTDIRVDYLGASGDSTYSPGLASRTNVLEFTAGTNGSYNSNNFASAGVTDVLSGGIGLGMVTNMVDPGGATNQPARYYRVRVLVP